MPDALHDRAQALKLHGLLAHWETVCEQPWVAELLQWEEHERTRRGLERRMKQARTGRFKPLADFDWSWPKRIDQQAVMALMQLSFLEAADNIVLIGPNGVGKSTIACNVAHQAVMRGHTVLFTTASEMLNDLAAREGNAALRRRLKRYAQPSLLVIDEIGYLSYDDRHADLLFEVVNQRYETKSILATTNRPFSEWGQIFPNASCVVSLVDRLVHHAELIPIEADSYRIKEAQERAQRKRTRKKT